MAKNAVSDWDTTTAGNNTDVGGINIDEGWPASNMNNALREIMKQVGTQLGKLNVKGADIASAATVNLANATGNYVTITGSTTITGLGTVTAGRAFVLRFSGALTLTHNATSLILPTGANITTAAGDIAVMRSEGSGNWRCIGYQRASGRALAGLPASSTDNAVARYDGTTGALQNSGVTIDDSNNVAGVRGLDSKAGTNSTTDYPLTISNSAGSQVSSFGAYGASLGSPGTGNYTFTYTGTVTFSGAVSTQAFSATTGAFSGAVELGNISKIKGAGVGVGTSYLRFDDSAGTRLGYVGAGSSNTNINLVSDSGNIALTTGSGAGTITLSGSVALGSNTLATTGAVSTGALTSTTGTFSGAVSTGALTSTTGTFSGALSGTTGAFSGIVEMANVSRIKGTGTGVGQSYLAFYDSVGTRLGLVGGGSASNADMSLSADSGNIRLTASTGDQIIMTATGGVTIGGNTVWHAGNDGSGSGLDADTVDGIQGASLVQTARTITAGNGLTGGGTLAADRTLTLGTPGTLTPSSTDAVTATSHTHNVATATQGEAEAGAVHTSFMTPLRTAQAITAHQASAKAWVSFNGTGAVAIRDSYNVSSITDLGTGQYRANFASALANGNYAVGSTATDVLSAAAAVVGVVHRSALTTSFEFNTKTAPATFVDCPQVDLIIMGD